MSDNDYLKDLLKSQRMEEGCDQLVALDEERDKVDALLREAFPNSDPDFTHGGSRAKGTMIREDYDLDEVCYFDNDDTGPGETLEEIYNNVAEMLEDEYIVVRKRSALRLKSKKGKDLYVDIVPGRYIDDNSTDVFLHQNEGDKERLKTNLETHISYVRDSGCTDVIQLGKLWRTRNDILIRTFPLELLIIEVLSGDNSGTLQERFERVLTAFVDEIDDIAIEDPANPTGNDLSFALTDKLRNRLRTVAEDTLDTAGEYGWEHVFGKVEKKATVLPRVAALTAAAASVGAAAPPWSDEA
ncbi:hypothetical protein DPM33_03070 [Mesorhizobium hawassense]|uniref:Nucleotidyltransferase n=1 Tax=Mesorhizobium hawassense TaxID=1209954 RepID=A0A330HZA8_9HYPH|nr:hypothetical protein [Mesorhizobium hawassense]RAZ92860.1 hypothetical protein DPM33_03070 [Mesorhizobium hawassense]